LADSAVEPEDYEVTQHEIITKLHTYQDPETGQYPFALALTRADAEMLNLWSNPDSPSVFVSHRYYAVSGDVDVRKS